MKRDRALAVKNKMRSTENNNNNDNDDNIFMFEVGKKGKLVDITRQTRNTTTTTTNVTVVEEDVEDEASLARKAAAAAVVATHHKLTLEEEDEYVNTGNGNFSTDSLGLIPGDLDLTEDPVELLQEAELALAEAENVTSGRAGETVTLGDGVKVMLGDEDFKSALEEANDILNELDEMTKVEVTRELQISEDKQATAVIRASS